MNRQRQRSVHIRSSDITPEEHYFSRRRFFALAGLAGAGAVLAACGVPEGNVSPQRGAISGPTAENTPVADGSAPGSGATPESSAGTDSPATTVAGEPLTPEDAVNGFNNFYEFTTSKERVATAAADLTVSPWNVEVGGLVRKPGTFAVEDLVKRYPPQERIYRMRCVEGWSMVIPWLGFPLAQLLRDVEPQAEAKFVRFVTLYDPEQMPGQLNPNYPWPYEEGLRLDEAQHDLTIIASGLYGKSLLPQTGAPLRLVVPWKYGFKSIKSIVKIDLVKDQPPTLWSQLAPNEYGFYSNVNPNVPHPRWSQATERRIGDSDRIPTLLFNGYGEEVAHLYQGMDLTKEF